MLTSVNGKASDAAYWGFPLLKIMVRRVAAAMVHEGLGTPSVVETKKGAPATVHERKHALLHGRAKKTVP
ncbi:MAG: hypothetical protein R3E55_00635 [Burkholderiaceae bacterium]